MRLSRGEGILQEQEEHIARLSETSPCGLAQGSMISVKLRLKR